MSRNQSLAFMAGIIAFFGLLTVAVLANQPKAEAANLSDANPWVENYMANAPTVPTCYVNHGQFTDAVPCNDQSVIDAHNDYERDVDQRLKRLAKH